MRAAAGGQDEFGRDLPRVLPAGGTSTGAAKLPAPRAGMAGKLAPYWLKAAATNDAESSPHAQHANPLRGALRAAVHGRALPVDYVHEGTTLLMLAASRGRVECIEVLLREFGAGPGAVEAAEGDDESAEGATSASEALRLAIDLDQPEAAAALLAWAEANAGGEEEEEEEEAGEPEPELDAEQMYEEMLAKKKEREPRHIAAAAALPSGQAAGTISGERQVRPTSSFPSQISHTSLISPFLACFDSLRPVRRGRPALRSWTLSSPSLLPLPLPLPLPQPLLLFQRWVLP